MSTTQITFSPIDNSSPADIKAMAPERANVYAICDVSDGAANYGFARSVILRAMAPQPLFENIVDGTVIGREAGEHLLAFGIIWKKLLTQQGCWYIIRVLINQPNYIMKRKIQNLTHRAWHHFMKNHVKTDAGIECEYEGVTYTALNATQLMVKLKRAISKHLHETDPRYK